MDARRRMHRSFLRWMNNTHSGLAYPITCVKENEATVECRITGIAHEIKIHLATGISIVVEWAGQDWDTLRDFDCIPFQAKYGYICLHCQDTDQMPEATEEMFWRRRLFAPLAAWIAELHLAKSLLLYAAPQGPDHGTWARLDSERSNDHLARNEKYLVETVPIHCSH